MQTCEVCNKPCSDAICIRQDVGMDLGDDLKESLNVYYFCSDVHYENAKQIINHLIKDHGYDIPALEIALNKHLKNEI